VAGGWVLYCDMTDSAADVKAWTEAAGGRAVLFAHVLDDHCLIEPLILVIEVFLCGLYSSCAKFT
jgi:hypothetical protein